MFNIIIFLIGAGIMFYMAWRSWSRRRKLMTRGEKVEAAVAGTVQSRDGEAYLLEFTTAGGTPNIISRVSYIIRIRIQTVYHINEFSFFIFLSGVNISSRIQCSDFIEIGRNILI